MSTFILRVVLTGATKVLVKVSKNKNLNKKRHIYDLTSVPGHWLTFSLF